MGAIKPTIYGIQNTKTVTFGWRVIGDSWKEFYCKKFTYNVRVQMSNRVWMRFGIPMNWPSVCCVGCLPWPDDGDSAESVPHIVSGKGLRLSTGICEFGVLRCVRLCVHARRQKSNCHPFSCIQHKVVPQRSTFLALMSACPGINWTVPVIDNPRSPQQNRQATAISSGCLVRPSHTHDNTYFIATAACLSLPLIVR